MNCTDSRTCLVGNELVCSDSEYGDGFHSMECDWESCSSHDGSETSAAECDRSTSLCPRQLHQAQHGRAHHSQQRPTQEQTPTTSDQEVMFYSSTKALWDSLAYITSLKDMCDVIFYVGKKRHPVYGVKSLLSVRSRVMYLKILEAQRTIHVAQKTTRKRFSHKSTVDIARDGIVHIDVKDYDPKVFSQFVDFLHSGRVQVHANTALGLYCVSTEYEVVDLRKACWDFVERCAQRGHAYTLLVSGRQYMGRTCLDKLSLKLCTLRVIKTCCSNAATVR